jgi:hypothetical protein
MPYLNMLTSNFYSYIHLDIALIEQGSDIYCIIRGIPYTMPNNPYVNKSDGGQGALLPPYAKPTTQSSNPGGNVAALNAGSAYTPLPVLNSAVALNGTTITMPIPTMVLALNSNPMAQGTRNFGINAGSINSCFASVYEGLPGYETQGTTGVQLPPPLLMATTSFTASVQSMYLV